MGLNMSFLFALMLIPGISLLNHLGGQSTRIPDPRIVCRVMLIPLFITVVFMLCGASIDRQAIMLIISTIGFALWAVPAWGEMFMALNGENHRDYTKYKWLAVTCDKICGVTPTTVLTVAQCKKWGTVYGCMRGAFLYPFFIALSVFLTPISAAIGLICIIQGFVYRYSKFVLYAEYIFGAIIGGALASILIISG